MQSPEANASEQPDTERGEAFTLAYDELRRLAGGYLRAERPDHTLQPTALVHEAYLKLGRRSEHGYENRQHFLATAARAMRQILVDHARGKKTKKRDGQTVVLGTSLVGENGRPVDLIDLDRALHHLQQQDPQRGTIVELHFFGGLTVNETAEVLGIAERTVFRKLRSSKAWLKATLLPQPSTP